MGVCPQCHDQAENDDETGVKHQLGDETSWCDLVNVSGVVTLGEAGNCGPKVASTVEHEGSIFSVLACQNGAEGGVDVIARNGGCVGSHVRSDVDHGSVEYEVIGKICDHVPIVAGLEGSVSQTKRGDSLGIEGTKLTIRCGLAGVVGRCVEGKAFTRGVEAGGSLKLIGNILPGKFGRECLDVGVAGLGRIEHEAPNGHKTWGRADANELGFVSFVGLWAKDALKSNGDETYCPTETDDDEAESDLPSPRLLFLLVVEAAY